AATLSLPDCAACRNPKTVPAGVPRPNGSAEVWVGEFAGADGRCRIWSNAPWACIGRNAISRRTDRPTFLLKEDMVFSPPGFGLQAQTYKLGALPDYTLFSR